MIVIARHINGISLNPLEYVLEGPEPSLVKQFNNSIEAGRYLSENGYTSKEVATLKFLPYMKEMDQEVLSGGA
jgi:hypothetical protein